MSMEHPDIVRWGPKLAAAIGRPLEPADVAPVSSLDLLDPQQREVARVLAGVSTSLCVMYLHVLVPRAGVGAVVRFIEATLRAPT